MPIVVTVLGEMIDIKLTAVFVSKCLYGTPTQLPYDNVLLLVHHCVTGKCFSSTDIRQKRSFSKGSFLAKLFFGRLY